MLAKNVEILDIDPDQHERLAGLFSSGDAKKKGLILFYGENRLIHAVHTARGPVENVRFRGPAHLAELAAEHGTDFVLCIERNAIRRITADVQSNVLFEDPLSLQGLTIYSALKRELGAGLHIYPDVLGKIPPAPPVLLKLGRRLLARDGLFMAVVFDNHGEVWISAIIEVRKGEVSLITTTDFLAPLELDGLPLEERMKALISRLEERRGKPTFGLFCDRAAFAHLMNHTRPVPELIRMTRRGWIRAYPFPGKWRLVFRFAPFFGF